MQGKSVYACIYRDRFTFSQVHAMILQPLMQTHTFMTTSAPTSTACHVRSAMFSPNVLVPCQDSMLLRALQGAVHWAAQYNTWLLIKLMPKGIVFSFLFLSFSTWATQSTVLQHLE